MKITIDIHESQGDGGPDSPQAPYLVTVWPKGREKTETWLHDLDEVWLVIKNAIREEKEKRP